MAAFELGDLTWRVEPRGYETVQGRPARVLREPEVGDPADDQDPSYLFVVPVASSAKPRRYKPLAEHLGLFLTFADSSATEEGVLEFARNYGALGGIGLYEIDEIDALTGAGSREVERERAGEPLAEWLRQIRSMNRCVQLWRTDILRPPPRSKQGRSRQGPQTDYSEISTEVERHLRGALSGGLAIESTQQRPALELKPTSLLAALWLQFAIAVSLEKNYRRCAECGRWFEVSRSFRYEKQFCSKACKQESYRSRQRRARLLFLVGLPVPEIARKLASKKTTVQRWVQRKPDKMELALREALEKDKSLRKRLLGLHGEARKKGRKP